MTGLPFQSSLAALFGYRGIPFAVRTIFRREFVHFATWGLIWGALNVNFCGYIATRGLDAGGVFVSFVVAANAISNLLAVWWGSAAVRYPKRTLITIAMTGITLVMLSFAVTPALPSSVVVAVFTVQVLVAWFCIAGVGTIRANVWRSNYPDSHRARILGRLLMLPVVIGSLWLNAQHRDRPRAAQARVVPQQQRTDLDGVQHARGSTLLQQRLVDVHPPLMQRMPFVRRVGHDRPQGALPPEGAFVADIARHGHARGPYSYTGAPPGGRVLNRRCSQWYWEGSSWIQRCSSTFMRAASATSSPLG